MTTRYSGLERACLGAVTTVMRSHRFIPPHRSFHRVFGAEVTGLTRIAPEVRRLTLKANELATLELTGPDEYCGLLMPPPDQPLVLPEGAKLNPRSELARLPERVRPELRWYTIRHHRPSVGEVDIDIVTHSQGPGEEFLRRVKVGDAVGVREGVASYWPCPDRHILIGDETAAPAVGAILESLPAGAPVDVFIEAPSDAHLVEPDSGLGVTTLFRGDAPPGFLLRTVLQQASLPVYSFGWIAGEMGMVKDIRRWLVEHGTDRRRIAFSSYWILGRPRP